MEIKITMYRDYGMQLAEQLGTQGASGILGEGMGLLFQNQQNQNQINQQQKLTDMQVKAQEQLGDYNYGNQMKLYNATGPSTQVANLEKAGLNPALMYGAGAGGGGSTQGASAGSATGGHAQESNSNNAMLQGMGLQNQQTQSQIELTNAQTNKIKAETPTDTNTADVQNANTKASTASITQGITNQQTQNALMQAQTAATNITAENVQTDTKKIEDQIQILDNDATVSRSTVEDKIKTIHQTAVNALITSAVMKMGIQVDKAQIQNWSNQIANQKQGLTIEQQKANIQQLVGTASSGLMDKEKSLLLTQTIMNGVGQLGNLIGKMKGGRPVDIDSKTTIHNYNAENSY